MKPKAILFLVVFCLALGFLVVDGLCATAKKGENRVLRESSPSETMQAISSPSKYSTAGFKDESDCYNLIPDPEVPVATEHDLVGLTWYDYQKNGSMGRMIAATTAGLGGYRHVSWMWTAGDYATNPRGVLARSKPLAGAWGTTPQAGFSAINSGYCNQMQLNNGTSAVIFHSTAGIGGQWSSLSVAGELHNNPLFGRKWDLPDAMPQGASGEEGAWPKGEVLYCIDETVHPDPLNYFHVVELEGNTSGVDAKWIGYLRCYIDPTNVNNLKCQTPTTGGEVYNITANTNFQDEVYGFDGSCDWSPAIATGRGIVGKRVAIGYMPMANGVNCDYYSDAAYIECMDNGDGWIDGTDWLPTIHNLTNFGTTGNERAYHDLSMCYDYEDSLHITYLVGVFDPSTQELSFNSRIYHWSKENGHSMIASKMEQAPANPGGHNLYISKMNISAKDPIYHPGGDSTYLFCIWTGVDTSDLNFAGDLGNHDIYGSGSFDGGNTWGKVLNLTGTHSPGCAPGECVSEMWPSLARNMLNGDLHIEYICDRDPGGAITPQGSWTENYVMYMRLPEWEVEAGPRGEYKIIDPSHWYHPPIKILPNQTRSITFKVFSIGNEALTYSVTSDNPCVQVSVPPTQLAIKDSVEVPVLIYGTGACNGTFIAGNVILSTDEAGGKVEYLRVHAVVADDYYECPRDPETFDTLENDYLRLYVNANCQQWIHDIGWNVPLDTTHQVFFQGGTIVATTSGDDTLVGRYMGENDMRSGAQDKLYLEQCEPDWEPHFWILYTKEIYIEASHLSPPNHFKWFWWEIGKQVKFFKNTAPEDYQRIVIKYIKVKRQDPPGWWPDLTSFTSYDDTYIGLAMDLDAPFDTSDGEDNESASNYGRYDDVNDIAYVVGFGRTGEHPEYSDYHAGIALAEVNRVPTTSPYATANVKNNQYLYKRTPWGWYDGQLYQLASTPGNYIQDGPATFDSTVDRTIVMTAHKIVAGDDPNMKAEFTIVEVLAPTGLLQMQALVDTGRAIVARERQQGQVDGRALPAICGDANGDFIVDVGDLVYIKNYCYVNGPEPPCPYGRGDANNDGIIDVGDLVYIKNFCYTNGPEPKCPGIWYWTY